MTTTLESSTSVTAGFDIGAHTVKMAILSHSGARTAVLAKTVLRVPSSRDIDDARAVVRESWRQLLTDADLSARDIDNMASTGAGASHVIRVGFLCGHSIHALGARLLFPEATVALHIDGKQIHCELFEDAGERSAEGDDHPLWTLTRRAEVHLDRPSAPSAGNPLPESLVTRAASLAGSLATGGKVVLTGEMVLDTAFVQRLWSRLLAQSNVPLLVSPEAIFAGAYGAAILAARRFTRISGSRVPGFNDPSVASPPRWGDRSLN